ncbi:MAG: hypothetical protein ACR2LJ_11105 [Acidimicrobiales bacterium]
MTPSIPAIRRLGITILVVYAQAPSPWHDGPSASPIVRGCRSVLAYRWVNPPPDFAAGNVKTDPATTDIELDATGSKPTGLSTSDGQVVLNLPTGAVAPHPGDTKIALTVTALDPATLGGLPGGLRANGNAYRIQAAYQPSGTAIDSFAQAGNLVLGVPEPFRVLLFSVDGRSWEQLPPSKSELPAADSRIGYFLGTVESSVAPLTPRGSAGNGGVMVVVLVVVVLALAFGLVPVIYLRRRNRRAASSARRPPPRTGTSGQRKTTKKQKK